MLITIYDSYGTPKAELSPNDSSTQVKEVQGDSVLTLSFTHYDHIALDVDDYVDFEGERFWLTEKYRPKQNSRKEWNYDIKFYGVESMLKRLLVIKTVDGEDEPEFTLTAPPHEHVAMIVKCMNAGMGNITDWKVGTVNGSENIVIDYFGKYCDEALKEIAEKVGAEWWVEGQTVNICRCEHGESIPMGYNKGLLSVDPGTADNVKFYTRLYPVGSSRNIDSENYGHSRLQLPDGKKYVEINADKYGRVDHYEKDAFADIYPKRIGTVSGVRSEVKTGEDGNPFAIYYFSDNELTFNPNDYEIGGLVKRVSFQEGSELGGLGSEDNGTYYFEVNYNETTSEFEIITIWPYDDDTQLPGGSLVPKVGDKYILWNLRMPDEYYGLAEEEFMEAVEKYNADHDLDIAVYKSPTDHVWIEDNEVELTIGQRIRLESNEYFPGTGYRDSRITKITRKVNLPSSMDIEISDALSRTSQEKMSDSIADVRNYAKSIKESTSLPDIIRTGDRTKPTDNNLFSARKSIVEFTRKAVVERISALWHFIKGFTVGNFISGISGAQIDENGNAEVESLTSRSYLKVFELIYNRIATQEGETNFSDSGTIDYIYENTSAGITAQLRKRWDGDFTSFQPGDIVYGYVNNLDKATAKEYGKAWARITSVNRESNVITFAPYSDAEVPGGVNLALTNSMNIARYGNAIVANATTAANPDYAPFIKQKNGKWVNTRQSTFFISTDSGNLMELMGVNKPIITKENMGLVLGKIPDGLLPDNIAESLNPEQPYLYARGILVQDLIRIGYEGLQPRTSNYRGLWNAQTAASATEYYRNTSDMFDTVSHNGAMWQNVTPQTTDEPSDSASGWLRMTGSQEQTRGLWQIVPNASQIWIGEDESIYPTVLSVKVLRSSLNGDVEYTDNSALIAAGAKLQYSIDDAELVWHDFAMGLSESFETESGLGLTGDNALLTLESGDPLMTEGDDFTDLSGVEKNITFRLIDTWVNGQEFTRVTVPVIRDGTSVGIASTKVRYIGTTTDSRPADSEFTYGWGSAFMLKIAQNGWIYIWSRTEVVYTDGKSTVTYSRTKDGDRGANGSMVYPAGVFEAGKSYDAADGACPVVEYNGIYYLLEPGNVYNSSALDDSVYPNPAQASAANYKWQQFTTFESVFTNVLMANYANIGSMIFYSDTIFSQDGRLEFNTGTWDYAKGEYVKRYIDVTGLDGNGKAWYLRLNNDNSTVYSNWELYIENGDYLTNPNFGKFIPNVSINFKTGKVQTNNGLEIGQTNNPEEAAVAIVGHGNIISDGVIGGGLKFYEIATDEWNSPAASTLSLCYRGSSSIGSTIKLPSMRESLKAMGRAKESGNGDTAIYDDSTPFAYVITYLNTYYSAGNFKIEGGSVGGFPAHSASGQSTIPGLVDSRKDYSGTKPSSTTVTLKPGQSVKILIEYTGKMQSQSYKGSYIAYII